MKKNYLLRIFVIVAIALNFAVCESCNKPTPEPGGPEDLPFDEQILEYFEKDVLFPVEFVGGYSAYIDFSDGPNDAFPENSDFKDDLKEIAYFITMQDWEIYSLGEEEVRLMEDRDDGNTLIRKITENKDDKYAPIDAALDSIVAKKKRSLLITDFELYKRDEGVSIGPYAGKRFAEWVDAGGIIKFYVFPYIENGSIEKKMFYVIFDSADKELIDKFEQKLNQNIKNYNTFVLDPISSVSTVYEKGKKGLNESLSNFIIPNNNDDIYENKKMEFYEFQPYLKDIIKLKPEYMFKFLNADLTTNDAYSINGLKLMVYDVKNDFIKYSDYRTALRNPLDSTNDKNSDSVKVKYTCNSHPCAYMYYDTVTGRLKNEFAYSSPNTPLPLVKNVFEVECGGKLKENFELNTDKAISIKITDDTTLCKDSDDGLLRIDVCYDAVEFKYNKDSVKDIFTFDKDNECIYQSIVQTIDGSNRYQLLKNKVIYTYFIKTPAFETYKAGLYNK